MPDITRECAERLIDIASTVGILQGMAAGGYADPDTVEDVLKAVKGLGSACILSEEFGKASEELSERTKGLLKKTKNNTEIELDERLALQDSMNAVVNAALGDKYA